MNTLELGDRGQLIQLTVVDLLGRLEENATSRKPRRVIDTAIPAKHPERRLANPEGPRHAAAENFELDGLESLAIANEPLIVAGRATHPQHHPAAVLDEVRRLDDVEVLVGVRRKHLTSHHLTLKATASEGVEGHASLTH